MNLSRLPAILILLSVFALAACGNKADLFMPPPPDDEGVVDDQDRDDAVEEEVIEDEAASQEATGLPLPVPTGAGQDQPVSPPSDEDPELPLPVPTGDE
ncbi:MAG: LPS translocon maturation chaperone LptM [Luteimonas sp.]